MVLDCVYAGAFELMAAKREPCSYYTGHNDDNTSEASLPRRRNLAIGIETKQIRRWFKV
jgi:hypothetical protein